jgi:hypothetical protein
VEDIEACAREGRRPRDNGPYRIQVGDALFRFQAVVSPEAVPTGRDLLALAALHPHEHIVFAVLTDGLLEEIRLEEAIDLRGGVEKFLAFKNDRIFRFLLDGRDYQWGGAYISGATLLKLAKLDPAGHGVWLEIADGEERPIRRTELVDLGEPGVEAFVTRPLAAASA